MLSAFVSGARPKTIPAAVVPVAVATALAEADGGFDALIAGLCLVVSLALQVATNYVNDYADGQRGADGQNRVGPSRLVGSGRATVKQVKVAAAASFAVAGFAGLILSAMVGYELLIVGAVSILAGWAYTGGSKPYAYMGLGEVFVFVFFGLVATVGTYYAQLEQVTGLAVLLGSIVGLLSVALLITNNLRDIEGDAEVDKFTLAVRLGDFPTRLLFAGVLVSAALGVLLVGLDFSLVLFALLGFVPALKAVATVLQYRARGLDLIPVLEMTSLTQILVGIGLSLGLVFS